MRLAGRITDWNDDKGFGFVVPHDGGNRTFVHIKSFQAGSRRPFEGDLISYEASRDAKGRSNAVNVRFAGQRIEQPSRKSAPLASRSCHSEMSGSSSRWARRVWKWPVSPLPPYTPILPA